MSVLLILVVMVCILLFFAGNKMTKLVFSRNGKREEALNAEHNQIETPENDLLRPVEEKKLEWLHTHSEHQEQLTSKDGLELTGFFYYQKEYTSTWVILIHGFGGSHKDLYDKAPYFHELGFNLLLPDGRGHGASEGQYIGFGWPERRDIQQWIEVILAKDSQAKIILYGISMGAATVMMTAGEALPENVVGAIEDCGYSSVKEELAYQLKQVYHLPAFPLLSIVSFLNERHQGWWLSEADAVKQLEKSRLPMLFIHGTGDTFVPFSMLEKNYQALDAPKMKLSVKGAQHGMAGIVGGDKYWQAIEEFLAVKTEIYK